jgi:hypothetical protein
MQVDLDVTVSLIADMGGNIWKVTALATPGVDATKPSELRLDPTNGVQLYFTAPSGTGGPLVAEKIFPIGRRFIAHITLLGP